MTQYPSKNKCLLATGNVSLLRSSRNELIQLGHNEA